MSIERHMPVITREGVWKWRWQFATQRLRDAYDASRASLDKTLRDLDKEHKKWRKEQPDPTDQDEMDAHDHWGDNIGDRHDATTKALDTLKQGFAVVLYHSWEKNAVGWAGWGDKRYHHGSITGELKKLGFVIEPGVHKLQKVANCIKHNSPELWKQDEAMFDPVVGELIGMGLKPDYSRNLRLTDAHMDEFFDALLTSGPAGEATPTL
jgi:hypothetical protein